MTTLRKDPISAPKTAGMTDTVTAASWWLDRLDGEARGHDEPRGVADLLVGEPDHADVHRHRQGGAEVVGQPRYARGGAREDRPLDALGVLLHPVEVQRVA